MDTAVAASEVKTAVSAAESGQSGSVEYERIAEVQCSKDDLPVYQYVDCRLQGHGAAVLSLKGGREHEELLLSTSKDCTCRVWDLEKAQSVRTIIAHSDAVRSAVFSVDDRLIFTAGDKCVRVWDRLSPREVACFKGHHGHVTCVDVQMRALGTVNYGLTMISSSFDCSTKVWDLRSQLPIRTCIGHQKPVTSCTLMPDGTTVISGGLDAVCRFFDAGSVTANVPYTLANPMCNARQVRVLKSAKTPIAKVRYSPDAKWLAACCHDGIVGITRIGPDYTTQFMGHPPDEGSCDCAWHELGTQIATAGGRDVLIWDIRYLLAYEEAKSKKKGSGSRPGTQGTSGTGAEAAGLDAARPAEEEQGGSGHGAESSERAETSGGAEEAASQDGRRTSGRGGTGVTVGSEEAAPLVPRPSALVRLTGAGIASRRSGHDSDVVRSILWLSKREAAGEGVRRGAAGAGLANRALGGGIILGGAEDGCISCWTVPHEATDFMPMESLEMED